MSKDAENFYAPLVMVAIWGQKMTLANKTVYQNGSIDASFDPPLFSLRFAPMRGIYLLKLRKTTALKKIFTRWFKFDLHVSIFSVCGDFSYFSLLHFL
jgi:hypothetical protein